MSLEEKIGQIFMAPACPFREEKHHQDLEELIKKYHVGNLILKAANPKAQVTMLNHLQSISNIPLLTAMDAEWGVAMMLVDTIAFPKNLTLGAIEDDKWIFNDGNIIGKQCKDVGVHINLAPVADVNSNPDNPIIHMRSFGQDPKKVADKTLAYLQGVEEAHVVACAKHFPGHGQPSQDSHKELPIVTRSKASLEKIDLYPFKEAVRHNVGAIMMGHLIVPSLDPSNKPATLSRAIVHDLLRKSWGYQGLIITDALNMKGLTNNYSVEDIAIEAFHAGNDILLYGDHIAPNVDRIIQNDIPKAYAAIKEAILQKKISEKELDEHVFRILQAKDRIGLLEKQENTVSDVELMDRLHNSYAYRLKKDLYCEAMTVIKNEKSLLPFSTQKKCYYLRMGDVDQDVFFDHLQKQLDIQAATIEEMTKDKQSYPIIVSIFSLDPKVKDYAVQPQWLKDIQKLNKTNQVVVVVFGTPYAAKFFESSNSVLIAYEEDPDAQIAAAQIIANKKRPKGILPVSASKKYPVGTSIVW